VDQKKSVVTCDLEGRIETVNQGAEKLFGYSAEELIGRKRVSIFSPGLVVLGHVQNWLKAAREQGEFVGQSVFLRRDGSRFTADIRITPTFRHGRQIGYCGVTQERPDIPPSLAFPKINFATRLFSWFVITRAPFLTATIIPILTAGAWVAARNPSDEFPWMLFWLVLIGGISMHIAANLFNDLFDWKSGTDPLNNDYFMPFSGGSRSIELGLISERGLRALAWVMLLIAVAAGLPFLALRGPVILAFGALAAFSVYFYTAPPIRLAGRRGLGELFIGLNFGPMLTAGTVLALTGSLTWSDFFIGLPLGLLTAAILWINQFPDAASDSLTGKINLVVVLGRQTARWGYLAMIFFAYLLVYVGVTFGILPSSALLSLVTIPLAVYAVITLFKHYAERSLIRANSTTILVHLITGLLLAMGIYFSGQVFPFA
jgi:1,4-dihydroxy-2-naphthoate polyprenyltransferase